MSIAALCVKRPVFAVMLISFLVVLGVFSFRDLGVDLFPRIDPATVTINVQLPGATAEIADKQIKRALETVNGVGEIALTGGRLRQIRVFADAEKLNAYGITIDQLESAVQNQNVEIPGGTIRRGASL